MSNQSKKIVNQLLSTAFMWGIPIATAISLSSQTQNHNENQLSQHTLMHEGGPVPRYNENKMPKTPVAVNCVLNLAIQYFVVYTALALFRAINSYNGTCSSLVRLFESATNTVNYAPMLSVLFLGIRMRAEQLTQGRTEEFALPDSSTQYWMKVAVYSVLGQLNLVLLIPVFTGELSATIPVDEDGNIDTNALADKMNKKVAYALTIARWGFMIGLYVGTVITIKSLWEMEAPKEIFPDGTPAVSPALKATVNLTTQFFIVYFALAVVKTLISFKGPTQGLLKMNSALQLAAYTLNLAPMLCILFIAARMRALMIDPINGAPQSWAQNSFYLCAYSILVQQIMVILTPYASSEIQCVKGDFEGDVKFVGLSGWKAYVLIILRYLALIATYAGFTIVAYSIYVIADKDGKQPPLSPTLFSVLLLCYQFFSIYLLMFIGQTCASLSQPKEVTTMVPNTTSPGGGRNSNKQQQMNVVRPTSKLSEGLSNFTKAIELCRATVQYAPMLSVIFFGTRLRALQLARATDSTIPPNAGPQKWVQDLMYLAVGSVFFQLVLCLALSAVYGVSAVSIDAEGNPIVTSTSSSSSASNIVGVFLKVFKVSATLAMYVSIVGMMVGIWHMTPEKVQPYSMGGIVDQLPESPVKIPEIVAGSSTSASGEVGSGTGAFMF